MAIGGEMVFETRLRMLSAKQSGFTILDLKAQGSSGMMLGASICTLKILPMRGGISNSLVSVATFGEPRTVDLGALYHF